MPVAPPVALVSTPDEFALTKGGRMLYQFTGSGRLATQGVLAKGVLLIASPVITGTKLVLRWAGVDHTLLFVANPKAANEFTAGDGSRAYMRALLAELKTYYPIREAFHLTEYDPTQLPGIVLSARQPGPLYDIVPTLPVGTPFGFGTTTAGADPIVRPQYSIYAEIWLQKVGSPGLDPDADFDRVFTPTIECDELGNAQFDVGNVLHARMQADFPDWHGSAPEIAQYSARKYFVTYGEAYGFPLQVGRVLSDQVRYAFWGGTDYLSQVDGGLSMLSYQTADPALDRALRMGPAVRFVRADEPQYISFLNSRANQAGCLLKVTRFFDDNTSDDKTAHWDALTLATGQKVSFAVGPQQLDLLNSLPPGRSLRDYTIQRVAADGVTPLSIEYRYILNYDYQAYTRYFGYINSLGALDTLTTFGKGSRELARFTEQAESYQPAFYQVQHGQFTDYNVGIQQQFEVTTGFRSEAELAGWDDFYRSAERVRIEAGRALPVGITSKSIKAAKDGDTQFAHSFAYSYLFRDDFFSEGSASSSALPPVGFVGAGGATINVQPTEVVVTADPTISDVVRGLTAAVVQKYNQAVAWGNHATFGYLTQSLASLLFRRNDQPISYTELSNKPTTRDEAGLTDVPVAGEITLETVLNSGNVGKRPIILKSVAGGEVPNVFIQRDATPDYAGLIVLGPDGNAVGTIGITPDNQVLAQMGGDDLFLAKKADFTLLTNQLSAVGTQATFYGLKLSRLPLTLLSDYVFVPVAGPAGTWELKAISNAVFADLLWKTYNKQAIASELAPYLSGQAIAGDDRSVEMVFCFQEAEGQGALTEFFTFLSTDMVGKPQYHGLAAEAGRIMCILFDAAGGLDQTMVISFPDLNHYQIDYTGEAANYPGGKIWLKPIRS